MLYKDKKEKIRKAIRNLYYLKKSKIKVAPKRLFAK